MNEMMAECCDDDGKLDLNKMKGFMEKCGKQDFSEEELAMMKQFCRPEGKPDAEQMKWCVCHTRRAMPDGSHDGNHAL